MVHINDMPFSSLNVLANGKLVGDLSVFPLGPIGNMNFMEIDLTQVFKLGNLKKTAPSNPVITLPFGKTQGFAFCKPYNPIKKKSWS
jgi:hypothetical protein